MAINSIITNSNAMTALRHLNETNRQMETTQGRISTGLKINNAVDDASNYTIAQGLRSDIKAMSVISQGLNNTKGVAQVAMAGATSVSNLLGDVRAKLTEMSNEGINQAQRDILHADLQALMEQIDDFITNSNFNDQNLLETGASNISTQANIDNANTIVLDAQDIQTNAGTLQTDITVIVTTNATMSLAVLNGTAFTDLEDTVNTALSGLGADIRALNLQTEFLSEISDATEEGLGNIVDADMARESAKLSSLQIRQELSMQIAGIANKAPQSLLSLFQ